MKNYRIIVKKYMFVCLLVSMLCVYVYLVGWGSRLYLRMDNCLGKYKYKYNYKYMYMYMLYVYALPGGMVSPVFEFTYE